MTLLCVCIRGDYMSTKWILIESLSIFIQSLAIIYFLHNRYDSKQKKKYTQLKLLLGLMFLGFTDTFMSIGFLDLYFGIVGVGYALSAHLLMLLYLVFKKHGSILQKVSGVMMVWAVTSGTSIAGAGFASFILLTPISNTSIYQHPSRLLASVFITMLQVIIFFTLAQKRTTNGVFQKNPALISNGVIVIEAIFLISLSYYTQTTALNAEQNYLLICLAIGALLATVTMFIIYELFALEEIKNGGLVMELQRLEMESNFFKEIYVMYSDMRTWRHEYKNNITALRALVEHGETEKALNYIDNIANESSKDNVTLQTGNLVLDAVVSSKLAVAQSQNIEVDIQAVYPEINRIDDNDLCAITGNLLDNAIEACARMGNTKETKFINFSITLKGKNLVISIINSYNNDELKRKGNKYLTMKKEPFHGIGITHVDSIVDKYNGHVLRNQDLGIFETHVMLPLLSPDESETKTKTETETAEV